MYRVKRISSRSSTISINGRSVTDSFDEEEKKESGRPRVKKTKRRVFIK